MTKILCIGAMLTAFPLAPNSCSAVLTNSVKGESTLTASDPHLASPPISHTLTFDPQTTKWIQATTEDRWIKKDAVFSTAFGGLIAMLAGIAASWYAHKLQLREKRGDEAEFATNVLRSIRREVVALQEIYDNGIGAMLNSSPSGEPFRASLGLTQNWFAVFDANAGSLGKLPPEVASQIVTVYTLMKQLIEEFRINNGYLHEEMQIEFMIMAREGEQHLKRRLQIMNGHMVEQAEKIRFVDQKLKAAVASLFKMLDAKQIT